MLEKRFRIDSKMILKFSDLLFLESSEVIFRFALALLNVHKDELLKRDNFEDIMDYIKNALPQISAATLEKITKDVSVKRVLILSINNFYSSFDQVFAMDIKKQLSEYQVEYHVLQEEISTTQHYMESLNKEKENRSHLESKLHFAESSIAQLEKTRSSQQSQIQALQSQVQSLETTVETLGQYLLQLFDTNHDIDMPGDVRRIVQQIGNLDQQRKKPVFVERKIGKSMSVNSNLGFPLKVLEELSETSERENVSLPSSKSQFFESTYQQLRKQSKMRPSQLEPKDESPTNGNGYLEGDANGLNGQNSQSNGNGNGKSPSHDEKTMRTSQDQLDSGIATPLTPVKGNNGIMETINGQDANANGPQALHPFGNCEDVNFKFNGTTQLKSLRPIHLRSSIGTATANEKHIDGRS